MPVSLVFSPSFGPCPPSLLAVLGDPLLLAGLCVLQRLLGQVALPLHLQVETVGDVRHQQVDQLANPEHKMLEYNDESKPQGQNVPAQLNSYRLIRFD